MEADAMLCRRCDAFALAIHGRSFSHVLHACAWRRAMAQIEFDSPHLRLHHGKRTTDRATDHQDGRSA